jgi:hypothetical protein
MLPTLIAPPPLAFQCPPLQPTVALRIECEPSAFVGHGLPLRTTAVRNTIMIVTLHDVPIKIKNVEFQRSHVFQVGISLMRRGVVAICDHSAVPFRVYSVAPCVQSP